MAHEAGAAVVGPRLTPNTRSAACQCPATSAASAGSAASACAARPCSIGKPTPATAYAAFQHAWIFAAVCLFAAGLGCVLVGHVKAGQGRPGTPS